MVLLIISLLGFLVIKHFFYWKIDNCNFDIDKIEFHAHRGFKKGCPENTMESFIKAVDNGFEWIELDVVSSKDGVLVCSHNFDLECETNGKGYIHKLNYNSFKSIYTGIYTFPNSKYLIPKLSDVAESLGDKIGLNIEIKFSSPFDLKTARALGSYLTKNPKKKVIVSSFNPIIIAYFKIFYRSIHTAFLFQNLEYYWLVNLIHPHYIHPRIDLINSKMILDSKNHNMGINAWTAENYPTIKHLMSLNINGIISDMDVTND